MFTADTIKSFKIIERIPALLVGVLFVFVSFQSSHKVGNFRESKFALVAPPQGVEHFTFGYGEVFSDLLWIRALQDFDFCEKKVDNINCTDNSWMFRMIDTITNISPHFRLPYAAGSLSLTVLVNDIKGASVIFDKAVKAFPNDWPILYRASYQALIEEKNNEKAAGLMLRAAQNGGPPWLYEASARLYSEEGKMAVAEGILADLKANNESEELIRNMEKKIESLRQKQAEKQKNR